MFIFWNQLVRAIVDSEGCTLLWILDQQSVQISQEL